MAPKVFWIAIGFHTIMVISEPVSTSFIRETPEDIKEALVNFPERVPSGPEVQTLYGTQLTLGDIRNDRAINRFIFNDLAQFQVIFQRLVQMVLNLGINPTLLPLVTDTIDEINIMLTHAGIRYNLVAQFALKRDELAQLRIDILQSSRSTDFMLFRPRLETMLAEIENILKTMFVR